ncbi:hypothetical protein [Litorisediminicola beolgyonensis]|uniref:Uncharacterized protein n=1 Tax=Litorisediminicola beolgyonensis TaxID=1173614 RepID=A0ABW3ZE93_9RHOB
MSKPVSNSEIEDVLSSIRRLVAESGRSSAPPARPSPDRSSFGGPALSEKLVLSPALRVPDEEPSEPEPEAFDAEETEAQIDLDEVVADTQTEDSQFLHERDSLSQPDSATETRDQFEFRRATGAEDDEFDAALYGSDHEDDDDLAELEDEAAWDDDADEDDVLEGAADGADALADEPDTSMDVAEELETSGTSGTGARAMLERLVRSEIAAVTEALASEETEDESDDDWEPAEIGAEVDATEDQFNDAASEDDWESDGPASVQDDEAQRASVTAAREADPTSDAGEQGETGDRIKVSLEQKIAELEAMIARSDEEWDGEDGSGGNAAFAAILGEAQPWQDADLDDAVEEAVATETYPETIDEPEDEPVPPAPRGRAPERVIPTRPARPTIDASTRFAPGEHDTVTPRRTATASGEHRLDLAAAMRQERAALIDEDMLREMVSDIVRQELQGSLGERITRNVRKLVRREIQRALSGTEFE